MLKDLFSKAKEAINSFIDKIDIKRTEELLDLIASCEGVIIFTGVGKSGLVAKKIALTMTSCGTRALFLSPTEALHGDIGIVTKQDLLVVFSKSGESDELLHLIPAMRTKGVKVASISCEAKSRLAKASDFTLTIPAQLEICPFNMAPTTSTITQMLVGDVLTIGLMQKKQFSLSDYAINHPAGRIGRRISLRVRDLMIQEPAIPLSSPDDKLVDSLVELSEKRCGCVLITDKNRHLLGIFTDGDLRRALQKKGALALQASMREVMTPCAKVCRPEELLLRAVEIMEGDQKNAITVLPVVEKEGLIVGLIKLHDIIQSGI